MVVCAYLLGIGTAGVIVIFNPARVLVACMPNIAPHVIPLPQ